MDANTLYLRPASLSDAPALRAIYAPYVEKTAITFEYTVPDVEAFAARMRATLRRYPYLVAVRGGEIVGYAYAGAFGERAAYAWAAEVSIYLREDQRRQGIGRRLYAALEALLRAQHVQTLYACIAYPDGADDVHLTKNSAQFHAHIGYRLVGEFSRCGYKFGTWYSMVWMEKHIGAHEAVLGAIAAVQFHIAMRPRQIGLRQIDRERRFCAAHRRVHRACARIREQVQKRLAFGHASDHFARHAVVEENARIQI